MMPKPNPNKRNDNRHSGEFKGMSSEKVLLETKPSFWLYSDNFILKIVVLFIMVFMFAPILTFVYTLHGQLVQNFHLAIDNVMFYAELILMILILVVIIKIILDILDWNYTNYVLTDSRIVIQRGFIHKERIMISYNKIQDIEIKQSLLERIIRVGDIIIYGANEMSETVLDDIPSPRDAEEIILNRMNAIGFINQNAYMNNSYQQQPNYNPQFQQPNYNLQYQQPNYQQQGYNPQYQQLNYEQQSYNPQYQQPNYNPQQYQQNEGYIQPDHNQTSNTYADNGYIQPEQYYPENEYKGYEEDVIIPDKSPDEEWTEKRNKSSQELDKEQIFRKHDEMFKKYKK